MVTLLACLAALPQLLVYAGHVRSGSYPGSAFKPRVDAMLGAAQAAADGGPFAVVHSGRRFSVAPGLLNDIGMAAILDVASRVRGTAVGVRTLGLVNLGFMTLALFGLIAVLEPRLHAALIPLFLLVPLSVREYRSVDTVAIHGALAVLGIVVGAGVGRRWPAAAGVPLGVLVFLVGKVRSVYGTYALLAAASVAMLAWLVFRDRRALARFGCLVLALAALEVPWRLAMHERASSPRVIDGETLRAHNFWEPFVSGIGWTENRWGIKPWDPWIAEFLAARVGQEAVPITTEEGERRARATYLSLWREAPFYLALLYLARVPAACREHFSLGLAGAVAWLSASLAALVAAVRRSDLGLLAALVPGVVLMLGLSFQTLVIDPRLIYANPLRFVSAYGLVVALGSLVALRAAKESSLRAS